MWSCADGLVLEDSFGFGVNDFEDCLGRTVHAREGCECLELKVKDTIAACDYQADTAIGINDGVLFHIRKVEKGARVILWRVCLVFDGLRAGQEPVPGR